MTVSSGVSLSANTFNPSGTGFWSESLAGNASLAAYIVWDSEIVFSFEDAAGNPVTVDNPIIHMDRVGGTDGIRGYYCHD